jgi:hypothetical protein
MIESKRSLIRKYFKSLLLIPFYYKDFKSVESFCLFIGYPRSGHSFLGALLDAHPQIIIAMEEDALHLVKHRFSKNQLYYCLVKNSYNFTYKLKNIWTGYSYAVSDSYQGKYKELKVIGDKKGGRSTILLGNEPKLYDLLEKKTQCDIKLIHTIRNPFDDISTMVKRNLHRFKGRERFLHEEKISLYFAKVSNNAQHKRNPKLQILDVYHEDFISEPVEQLKKMINFLGLDADDSYYNNCAAITYKTPHKSRYEIEWPDELKQKVVDKIRNYDFLKRYSFND